MAVARKTSEWAWPGAQQNMGIGDDAMYVGKWDALTGGTFLSSSLVSNNPAALALGEVYFIAANGFQVVQIPEGNPLVTFSGGSGSGAIAIVEMATNGASISDIHVIAGGTGYTSAPTTTIGPPPAGGTQATATATVSGGSVTSFVINQAGSGYQPLQTEEDAQFSLMGQFTGNYFYAIHIGYPGLDGSNESSLARISRAGTDYTYSDN